MQQVIIDGAATFTVSGSDNWGFVGCSFGEGGSGATGGSATAGSAA